ncbi:MAG: membrane dipeptidase, partial [Chitinophagaceae bacterium]
MRTLLTSLFMICAFYVSAQKAIGIHHKAILIDTHNDILSEVVEKGYQVDTDLTGKTHCFSAAQ